MVVLWDRLYRLPTPFDHAVHQVSHGNNCLYFDSVVANVRCHVVMLASGVCYTTRQRRCYCKTCKRRCAFVDDVILSESTDEQNRSSSEVRYQFISLLACMSVCYTIQVMTFFGRVQARQWQAGTVQDRSRLRESQTWTISDRDSIRPRQSQNKTISDDDNHRQLQS